jgi:hypothetical protein
MAQSLNGWEGIPSETDPRLKWGTVPGTNKQVLLNKDVLPVFLNMLAQVNRLVIPLDPGPLDGWEYRDARTTAQLSNHASGTASDMRYDVLKADRQQHMTAKQRTTMHKLLDKYVTSTGKRVFGWGGDWDLGTYMDEMHLEAIQSWSPGAQGANATAADFADVKKRLGIKDNGTRTIVALIVPPKKPVVSAQAAAADANALTAPPATPKKARKATAKKAAPKVAAEKKPAVKRTAKKATPPAV